jgi:galactokinase/mevalonate kinase-like predicted kinase
LKEDYNSFLAIFNYSWVLKKKTSSLIVDDDNLSKIDKELSNNKSVLGHKLCGAGGGGFYLTISKKDSLDIPYDSIKIGIDEQGVVGNELSTRM